MTYIFQAVTANGIAVFLLLLLLINFRRKYDMKSYENNLFFFMILSNFAQCIVETVTVIIDKKIFTGAVLLSNVLNTFLFANCIVFSAMWMLYANVKSGRYKIMKNKLIGILKLVPAAIVVLLSIVNLFAPVFFQITEENEYRRVGLYWLTYACTYLYLLMGTAIVFLQRKTVKATFLPAFTFLFPVLLASMLQLLFQGISLLWVGAALGLCSAYMSVLDENAYVDELSGLFSRRQFNQYIPMIPSKAKDTKLVLGMMIDIDNFKSINDIYGHLVGDEAIADAGHILRNAIKSDKMVFRYAGDEFVIIMQIGSTDEIAGFIDAINQKTENFNATKQKKYTLSFSIGHTVFIPGEDVNKFIGRMDAEMYKQKRKKRMQNKKTL